MAKVTLVSHTAKPLETLWRIWYASKSDAPLDAVDYFAPDPGELKQLFIDLYTQEVPVIENVSFTFILEGVSISFREQMVRHRVGVRVGDQLGVDMVPTLSESSWWSQSMRIMDMGRFARDQRYRVPQTVSNHKYKDAERIYHQTMIQIEDAYNALVRMGIPMEDARDLIPLGATHRISWTLNLRALKHTIGKRSCWILQASLWHEVIAQMIDELRTKVHPLFALLSNPPCIETSKDDFKACVFVHENERRMDGRDRLPPCPLWLTRECRRDLDSAVDRQKVPMMEQMRARAEQYRQFWRHDPYTWRDADV